MGTAILGIAASNPFATGTKRQLRMTAEGFSEAAWASCKVVTFTPHVGISIALTLAALVICLLLTLFGAGRKEDR
jgi:hypothetical protein